MRAALPGRHGRSAWRGLARPSLRHHRRRLCLGRARARAEIVHGVLWRITPRDRRHARRLRERRRRALSPPADRAVRGAAARPALVYLARRARRGPAEARLSRAGGRGGARLGFAGALHPLAGALVAGALARRARAGDRRGRDERHPPRHHSRPRAGRRLPRLRRATRRSGAASRAGCATAATASVEAVFAGPAEAVAGMIEACRKGPPRLAASTPSTSARRARTSCALRGQGDAFAVLPTGASRQAPAVGPNSSSNPRRSAMSTSGHAHRQAEIGEAGHAVARLRHAARHDAGEMRQLRLDVERDAVQRHPACARGCRWRRSCPRAVALVRPAHPDADAVLAPLAAHVEGGERADDPFLQRRRRRRARPASRRLRSSIT